MIEQEESRISRRKKRFNGPDFAVEDRSLKAVLTKHTFRNVKDFAALLPSTLESPDRLRVGSRKRFGFEMLINLYFCE